VVLTNPCRPEHLLSELQRVLDQRDDHSRPCEDERASQRLDRTDDLLKHTVQTVPPARRSLTRAHQRGDTTNPRIRTSDAGLSVMRQAAGLPA